MGKSRREFGTALLSLASGLTFAGQAGASTALALTLRQLSAASERAVLGTPVLRTSEWALVGGARRIVTRTRVVQEADWFSKDDELDEMEIMTLGGQVGEIGQVVSGEAALVPGERALLFVSREYSGYRRVTGMAQGHYLVSLGSTQGQPEQGQKSSRLVRSPHLPHLLPARRSRSGAPPEDLAVSALHEQSLPSARARVRGSR